MKDIHFNAEDVLGDQSVRDAFERTEAQRMAEGKGGILTPPNGEKYTLVDVTSPFFDVTSITLSLERTDYFSIMKARPAIQQSSEILRRYGHVMPSRNRIPQALGLQFLVVFKDEQLLAIQRAKDTFPFPETWSFSGEEQCAAVDFSWPEPERMMRYLLRTAVEEVFPLGRVTMPDKLLEVMSAITGDIESMRVWSVFLEVPTSTFQIFGVIQLGLTTDEYARNFTDFVQRGIGQGSHEGAYHSVPFSAAVDLVVGKPITAAPLFGDVPATISPQTLHPTSAYRLIRFLDAFKDNTIRQNDGS